MACRCVLRPAARSGSSQGQRLPYLREMMSQRKMHVFFNYPRGPRAVHPAGSLDRAWETSVSGTNLRRVAAPGQEPRRGKPCKPRAEPVATGAVAASTLQGLKLARNADAHPRANPLWAAGSVVNGNETRFEASHTFHCFAAGICSALRL